jgi:hypothetical protein
VLTPKVKSLLQTIFLIDLSVLQICRIYEFGSGSGSVTILSTPRRNIINANKLQNDDSDVGSVINLLCGSGSDGFNDGFPDSGPRPPDKHFFIFIR